MTEYTIRIVSQGKEYVTTVKVPDFDAALEKATSQLKSMGSGFIAGIQEDCKP